MFPLAFAAIAAIEMELLHLARAPITVLGGAVFIGLMALAGHKTRGARYALWCSLSWTLAWIVSMALTHVRPGELLTSAIWLPITGLVPALPFGAAADGLRLDRRGAPGTLLGRIEHLRVFSRPLIVLDLFIAIFAAGLVATGARRIDAEVLVAITATVTIVVALLGEATLHRLRRLTHETLEPTTDEPLLAHDGTRFDLGLGTDLHVRWAKSDDPYRSSRVAALVVRGSAEDTLRAARETIFVERACLAVMITLLLGLPLYVSSFF